MIVGKDIWHLNKTASTGHPHATRGHAFPAFAVSGGTQGIPPGLGLLRSKPGFRYFTSRCRLRTPHMPKYQTLYRGAGAQHARTSMESLAEKLAQELATKIPEAGGRHCLRFDLRFCSEF